MSATRVVLDLATASPDTEFSTAVLTRAGEIVGVSASSIRVAAGRLCRENKLRRTARGTYVLNPDGIPTYSEVEGWRTRTDRIRPWDGTWIAVEHSGLKRSDRTAARRHDQALRLAGFEEWKPTLAVRPNNLLGGTGSARRTLHRLGAASESAVMEIAHLAPEDDSTIRTLWNSEALLADIAEAREALTQAQTRLATISREEAARESLALGSAVIAVIVRNPLLPEELEPTQPLRELISHMLEYQDASRELWQSLLDF
ncbi:hypothetical protein [Rhodococcus qingshengii]|uniref:hypothetical protein n=1 Tax=Rhodococcus TaxID=1827 RepID=UPI001BADF87A|nr:hypothetical protein [Rhodococcus qingshengii]MBS3691375.1 hypothetical protein [Rhodococcus qingshengii]UGQ49872.1 hypothetical protein LRL17_17685 [Rhodococcus qingshengii]